MYFAVTGSYWLALGCGPNSEENVRYSSVRPGAGGVTSSGGTRTTVQGSGGKSGGGGSSVTLMVPTANGGSESPASCGSVDVRAEPKTVETKVDVPATVVFVFDQSASMNELWSGRPKWQVANDAIVAAFEPLQTRISAGAVLYPALDLNAAPACDWVTDLAGCLTTLLGSGGSLCPDVPPITSPPQLAITNGTGFLQAWKGIWASVSATTGAGTPTEKGLLQAEASLANPPPGNSALVLVTDGQPTCGSNEAAIAARLLQKKIKTYVVGLPGAAGAAVLDAVAIAGGTAPAGCSTNCYFSPNDSQGLEQSLASIATQTVTTTTVVSLEQCEYSLTPPAGANPTDVHLIVTDAASGRQYEVPRATPDGWTLSADQTSAVLTGVICDMAKAGAFSGFSFQYGCVTAPPLPPR